MSSSELSIISDQRDDNLSLGPDLGPGVTSDTPPLLMEADIRHLATLIIVMIILIVILIVSFILNIVIIIIHINNHSLKTVSNSFILNLLSINLLSSVSLMPLILLDLVLTDLAPAPLTMSGPTCLISNLASTLVFSLSQVAALLIALDHYTAIIFPLRYHHIVTRVRCNVCILVAWAGSLITSASLTCLQAPDSGLWPGSCSSHPGDIVTSVTILTTTFILPLLLSSLIYARIYCEAHDSSERNRKCSLKPSPSSDLSSELTPAGGQPGAPGSVRHRISNAGQLLVREEGRTAAVYLTSLALVTTCWGPQVLARLGLGSLPPTLVLYLASVYTLISPVVFACRNKKVQSELLKMFHLKNVNQSPEPRLNLRQRDNEGEVKSSGQRPGSLQYAANSFLSLPQSTDTSARSSFSSTSLTLTRLSVSGPCMEHI